MEKVYIAMVMALCNTMGIDVALVEGGPVPEGLQDRLMDKANAMKGIHGQYNELASKLQTLGNSLLKEGESNLSAADVLNRLPERIAMAKHGEAFLRNRQTEAVAWLQKAKVDPSKQESLSDVDKRESERLANSTDLQLLEDRIAQYSAEAKARFGSTVNMRSSLGEEVTLPEADATAGDINAIINRAQMDRVMPRAKEGGKE